MGFEPMEDIISASAGLANQSHKPLDQLSNKNWSGWWDSNPRPPAPKAGALARLRYTQKIFTLLQF